MSKSKIVTIPLSSLVEDMTIYPRHDVDESHVGLIVQAVEAGVQLPPIVADKKSKKMTDGWHRARAYKRVHGPTATVEVELIDYASEADMIYDAVKRNSSHGRRLDAMDRVRSIHMLEEKGVDRIRIAIALNTTEAKVEKLRIRIATSKSSGKASVPGTTKVTLKPPCRWMGDTTLTAEQVKAHDSAPGTSYLLVARQLKDGIRTKILNFEDEKLMEELCQLLEVLNEFVVKYCNEKKEEVA